jgi:hypothetical protein
MTPCRLDFYYCFVKRCWIHLYYRQKLQIWSKQITHSRLCLCTWLHSVTSFTFMSVYMTAQCQILYVYVCVHDCTVSHPSRLCLCTWLHSVTSFTFMSVYMTSQFHIVHFFLCLDDCTVSLPSRLYLCTWLHSVTSFTFMSVYMTAQCHILQSTYPLWLLQQSFILQDFCNLTFSPSLVRVTTSREWNPYSLALAMSWVRPTSYLCTEVLCCKHAFRGPANGPTERL